MAEDPQPHAKQRRAPLTGARLLETAVRYVERYQTSEAKLARFLKRKIRERGWEEGAPPPDIDAICRKMVRLGFVDDMLFAEARTRGLAHRGMGAGRIRQALGEAGIDAEMQAELLAKEDAVGAALLFARRKRFGPWGFHAGDPRQRRRQLAAMARAGHSFALACAIIDAGAEEELPAPGDERFANRF